MSLLPDGLGWAATAVFAVSYFFKQPARLRLAQALAATLWIVYGVLIHSLRVVAANVIVSSLALYSAWRGGVSG